MTRLGGMIVLAGLLAGGAAVAEPAAQPVTVSLTLKDHRFSPDRVTVPAGRPIRIELSNQDAATEEFDSQDLKVEQDVYPHDKASFTVGPLKPGTYNFMGEFHSATALGALVAKEP